MDEVLIREADKDDITSFYGIEQPYDMKAWVILWHGKPSAMAGFVRYENRWVIFSDIKEGVNAPKLLIFRVMKEALRIMLLEKNDIEIAVSHQTGIEKSKLYNKLGFTLFEKNGYSWFRNG